MSVAYKHTTFENGCRVRNGKDDVMFQHNNCFTCPLPMCVLDYNQGGSRGRALKRLRVYPDIHGLARCPEESKSVMVKIIATDHKVTVRTVWRWLKEFVEVSGNREQFLGNELLLGVESCQPKEL